jgi:hypothetical protein
VLNLNKQINSNRKGDVGLAHAITFFTMRGDIIGIPLSDSQPFDLFISERKENKYLPPKKVQVKTCNFKETRGKSTRYKVDIRSTGGSINNRYNKNFDSTESDYLFLIVETGERYLIPTEGLKATNSISLTENGYYERFRI